MVKLFRRLWRRFIGDRQSTATCKTSDSPTDAEYIKQLLQDAGGYLRQQELVARTKWSEATVSRKLARMEGNDQIVRHKVGRENIVCLPEAVPDWLASSPY